MDSFYAKYIKRILDVFCALAAMLVFCWLYAVIALLVRVKLGKPVIYKTERIGRDEKPFTLYKFRSMTDERDGSGELLPDDKRLTSFGRLLRASSLDELPEAWCILKGDMSVVGPRPLPGIYLPYYSPQEHHRHDVRPGLTGMAQVNGRNDLSWREKFQNDLQYIDQIGFKTDLLIVIKTVAKVLRREGIGQGSEIPVSLHIERADRVPTASGVQTSRSAAWNGDVFDDYNR